MIFRRTRRATQPQETLRQFSLNNSKGVDETKAVTDNTTVQHMENLKVNLDGSLSLRDPIAPHFNAIYTASGTAVKVIQIFSSLFIIVLDSGTFGVWDSAHKRFRSVNVDYDGRTLAQVSSFNPMLSFLHLEHAEVLKAATTTTLGNCTVSGNFDPRKDDAELYDVDEFNNFIGDAPRYLQIVLDDTVLDVTFEIKIPEPNEIIQSENGELPISVNTTLDNPYAIVDSYLNFNTDVKGVLLYMYTDENMLCKPTVNLDDLKVNELTESSKKLRHRPIVELPNSSNLLECAPYYKAFGTYSNRILHAAWLYSSDGVSWYSITPSSDKNIKVREKQDNGTIRTNTYAPFMPKHRKEKVSERPDCLKVLKDIWFKGLIQFKVVEVERISTGDDLHDKDDTEQQYKITTVIDSVTHYQNKSRFGTIANYDNGNSVLGKKLLYKNSIYSYGDASFKNTIFKSDAGSLITPYLNSLDTSVTGYSKVTAVVPWRDYLYIATESAAILATPDENGFYTKIVNTFVGIPEQDSKCCKATLNGIVFKSGSKIFMGYPSMYSEAEAVLNYTEISKPIESSLENIEYSECYALSTSSEYVLMLVKLASENAATEDTYTYSIRYNYVSKLWSVFKYPIPLKDAYVYQDGSIHAYRYGTGYVTEYTLNADADDTYADTVFNGTENVATPIEFKWDTGQKTDSISNTKQFVESKLVFATLNERDSFPFTTYVAIDGDPHVTITDTSTDAPFWKNSESIGVLGTAFRLGGVDTPATGAFNTLRQLVLRYSGKGKSIRHVIEGESTCNFKLYETYVRYKNLNVK